MVSSGQEVTRPPLQRTRHPNLRVHVHATACPYFQTSIRHTSPGSQRSLRSQSLEESTSVVDLHGQGRA